VEEIEFWRQVPRYLATRLTHRFAAPLWSARLAPLHYVQRKPPTLPEHAVAGWSRLRVRLSGICGTDLNLVTGRESLSLEPEASYPFIPGHEIVAEIDASAEPATDMDLQPGTRCAVWPPLGCRTRGAMAPCGPCRAGWDGLCERRGEAWPGPALGIGFSRETGGGWGEIFLAHRSQLWPLPSGVSDEDAVLLDPAATALAALLRTESPETERTLIVGGGTIGLLIAYLHHALHRPGSCDVLAHHEFQRDWGQRWGASASVVRGTTAFHDWAASRGMQARRVTGYGYVFRGVYDRVIVAAGTRSSLTWALHAVRPRGVVVVVAAPASLAGVDPTPLWYREVTCRGIYVYGPVPWDGELVHPYDVLIPRLGAGSIELRSLVSHTFALPDYATALATALDRAKGRALKVVFRPAAVG